MDIPSLIDLARVVLVAEPLHTRDEVIQLVAERLALGGDEDGPEPDAARIAEALLERERVATTAVGDGIAFPHAKIEGLPCARAAVALLPPPGIDLGAADGGPVRLLIAIVVPTDSVGEHLKALGAFARRLRAPDRRARLLGAPDPAALLAALGEGP